MKTVLAFAALTIPLLAQIQTIPANQPLNVSRGVINSNFSYLNTNKITATSTAVISLWTGSCSASTYLRADGSCQTPSGVTTSGQVIALWTGTCNATSYLRGDGSCQTPAGSGTVTSIATTSPITGGTITTTGTIACATCVTSAAALTANRLVLGGGSQATAVLGSLGTTTTLLHGNAAGAPTFAAVDLTADVMGVLPFANGGTGLPSAADNSIPLSTGAAWEAKLIPNCTDTGGQHLNYTDATNTLSCGTSSIGGSGGLPFTATRTSDTTMTFGSECSAANPCNVRRVNTLHAFTTQAVPVISAGTSTLYLYVSETGVMTCGHNGLTFTSNVGCTLAGSITAFPARSVPLWSWAAVSGVWAASGTDSRASMTSPISDPAYTTVAYSATPTFTAALIGTTFLMTLTGNVTSSTLVGATTGQTLTWRLCQDGTGSRTFVWPTNVLNAPVIDPTASACTTQSFVFDGTNAQALVTALVTGVTGGSITLPGSTSGSTTITPQATGTYGVTLPAATGTLMTTTSTDAVENKTIDGDVNTVSDLPYNSLKSTSRLGDGTKVQMAGAGTPGTNDCAKYDAADNVVTAGGPCVLASTLTTATALPKVSAANTLNESGILVDASDNVTAPGIVTSGTGASAGEFRSKELTAGGTDYVSWLAPDAITTTQRLKFPATANTAGQILAFAAPSSTISQASWISSFRVVAAPSAATDACTVNDAAIDTSFAYFCVATNTWLRVSIATWP